MEAIIIEVWHTESLRTQDLESYAPPILMLRTWAEAFAHEVCPGIETLSWTIDGLGMYQLLVRACHAFSVSLGPCSEYKMWKKRSVGWKGYSGIENVWFVLKLTALLRDC